MGAIALGIVTVGTNHAEGIGGKCQIAAGIVGIGCAEPSGINRNQCLPKVVKSFARACADFIGLAGQVSCTMQAGLSPEVGGCDSLGHTAEKHRGETADKGK